MFKRFLLAPTLIILLLLGIGQVSTPIAYAIGDKPFTFVWMSDTQYYSQHYPYIYDSMTEWIVENERNQSIKYAIHTGDIVDHMTNEFEWVQADLAMKKLDQAKIPYGVLAGNHDVGHSKLDYSTYSRYFGDARFKKAMCLRDLIKIMKPTLTKFKLAGTNSSFFTSGLVGMTKRFRGPKKSFKTTLTMQRLLRRIVTCKSMANALKMETNCLMN